MYKFPLDLIYIAYAIQKQTGIDCEVRFYFLFYSFPEESRQGISQVLCTADEDAAVLTVH